MLKLQYTLDNLKTKSFNTRTALYLFCLVILFWALFDGVVSYLVPIVITESGISKTLMGVILGTSSIAGALFDFLACRLFKNTYYKRFFMFMFAICLIVPFILYRADSFVWFILAMILWGVYYDFKGMGIFNFVSNFTPAEKHTESFSLIQVFLSLGYLISPLIVGFLIADSLNWKPFVLAWIFIGMAIIFFVILLLVTRNAQKFSQEEGHFLEAQVGIWHEALLWSKVGRILFPVLLMTFLISLTDAFFWTVGPLIAEDLISYMGDFSGLFMTMYVLPSLFVIFIVSFFTKRMGKKRIAVLAYFFGSVILICLAALSGSLFLFAAVFLASLGISLASPALNGAYADYISETVEYEKEIEGLQDFYVNLGYVVGPMLAGFMADRLGNLETFTLLGFVGGVCSLILLVAMPKAITVGKRMREQSS